MNNLDKILDYLVKKDVLSKEVAELALNTNSGYAYENILTNENSEPTEFLKELVKLTGKKLIIKDDKLVVK